MWKWLQPLLNDRLQVNGCEAFKRKEFNKEKDIAGGEYKIPEGFCVLRFFLRFHSYSLKILDKRFMKNNMHIEVGCS